MNEFNELPENHDNGLLYVVMALSDREFDVLLETVNDLTNAEIGDRLNLSRKTVETYRTRIGGKLGCSGYRVLARFARRHQTELRRIYELLFGKLPPLLDLVT
jgi:DNA-binding CsgD family transcriptional regulator